MASWLIRRVFQALLVVFVMTLLVFVAVNLIGNPVDIMISPNATQAQRLETIRALGFDLPLWRQYLAFVDNLFHGDIGDSFVFGQPGLHLIAQRLPATLELAVSALLLSVLIGIPLGLLAGLYPNRAFSQMILGGSILGFSLPTFWVGLMMILVFSVELGWLPAIGRGQTATVLGTDWAFLTWDGLQHLILPALNLALYQISMVLRLTSAGVRETLHKDFIKFARAKGLTWRRIVWVHVLKNILIPVVTVIGLSFGGTIAFAVVTETVFSYPGMGKLLIDSINLLDRPVIVAYLMIVVLIFVTVNLVVDLTYVLLDPRVRLGDRE